MKRNLPPVGACCAYVSVSHRSMPVIAVSKVLRGPGPSRGVGVARRHAVVVSASDTSVTWMLREDIITYGRDYLIVAKRAVKRYERATGVRLGWEPRGATSWINVPSWEFIRPVLREMQDQIIQDLAE